MDRYLRPNVEQQLDELYSAKVYTTINLENGFFHVLLAEDSKNCIAFNCHLGVYELGFVYHRVQTRRIRQVILLTYIDDVIIPSVTVEYGLNRLKTVLQVASENGLNIMWQKCSFVQTRVQYLGYIIQNGTIQPSENKN